MGTIVLHSARQCWTRFSGNRSGNVAIIFALAMVPILMGTAMGLDYVSAARKRTKLNAIADAAAISAVTPNMMGQTWAVAKLAATNMFIAQAASVAGLNLNPSDVVVSGGDKAGPTGTQRTVSVSYSGSSNDAFSSLLNRPTLAISNVAASFAATNPNIDFYLLLDTSPSMAIAASQAGISQMVALTPSQGGCAFACHETDPAADNLGNPGGEDNYALARNNGIQLRIDLVAQATQQLMDTAQSTEAITSAKYRMSVNTFDSYFNNVAPLSSNLTMVKTESANIQALTTYKNSWLTATNNDNDTNTNFDLGMSSINAAMVIPGAGTNNPGDSPKEFLFLVTDGVTDENNGGSRIMNAMGGSWCDTIKNRGIAIAVLYTTYNPLPTNSFYNTYIKPFQPSISTSLQSCATPGYFFQVDAGGDISSAMNALFQKAVGSAHLTQ